MVWLNCFIIIILLWIAWQDFSFRAVYCWSFALQLIGMGIYRGLLTSWSSALSDFSWNCSFLLLQLLFVSVYFSLKEKKWVNIFKNYFGLGDLFFLLSITVYFSFFNYILYYLLSLFVVLAVSLVVRYYDKKSDLKVPLAGGQAILLVVVMLVDQFSVKINLLGDGWLINYFKW